MKQNTFSPQRPGQTPASIAYDHGIRCPIKNQGTLEQGSEKKNLFFEVAGRSPGQRRFASARGAAVAAVAAPAEVAVVAALGAATKPSDKFRSAREPGKAPQAEGPTRQEAAKGGDGSGNLGTPSQLGPSKSWNSKVYISESENPPPTQKTNGKVALSFRMELQACSRAGQSDLGAPRHGDGGTLDAASRRRGIGRLSQTAGERDVRKATPGNST